MLPRSTISVFTHGDITPRNILIDEYDRITGIVDWEFVGWYPDYWEYANIMKPTEEKDWQEWMRYTAPQT
jgi:thiamine kinase-like enzyme